MPLQATSGAASYDAFGGGVPVVPNYIEDVFSTYLYTGTGNSVTQRIASGLDMSTKGGMVWVKNRTQVTDHQIYDTARGQQKYIRSNTTDAEFNSGANQVQYKTSGWDAFEYTNELNKVMASWTFRKQPKFFDVVTYTGNGTSKTITHNLGSTPACIITKRTDTTSNWLVYHRSIPTQRIYLNQTGAATGTIGVTSVGSTSYDVNGSSELNENNGTYVAYIFAHNAGGFGLTGTDNVISCGSFTTDGSGNATVSLGYEPQWLLIKSVTFGGWWLTDTMRGMSVASGDNVKALFANTSGAEINANEARPNATGFTVGPSGNLSSSDTFIYIAIRRGPMKVPTSGTSVFAPVTYAGNSAAQTITAGFRVDMELVGCRTGGQGWEQAFADRLRGNGRVLSSSNTDLEQNWSANLTNEFQSNTGTNRTDAYLNFSSLTFVDWMFQRAPSFFDEVCYTGTGSQQNITHNLGVAPELIFVKSRSAANGGLVYNKTITASKYLKLFFTGEGDRAVSNDTGGFAGVEPTSSVFTVGTYNNVNGSGSTYVAYLFTSCAGVSKVFNYTGNGSSQTINCGFTSGARLVLIKRTDAIGDWYIWDSARGIVSGNDPHLSLNTTDAEVTTDDTIDTDSTGFVVNQVSATNVNVSSATYIGLAIA